MAVTADVVDNAERTGMRPREIFEFFVLLPFGLGLFLGAARIGAQEFETVGHHMAYASLFSGFSWACYAVGCKVMSWLLRPWKPSLLAVLLTGHILGGFTLWWPLRDALNRRLRALPDAGVQLRGVLATARRGPRFVHRDHPAGHCLVAARELGGLSLPAGAPLRLCAGGQRRSCRPARPSAATPRPRQARRCRSNARPARPRPPAAEPRLFARLPANLRGGEIWALEAEEHYTKIHTSKGNTLLLMRFSDAIAEMDPQPGLQVHRSFWVSRRAVERVARVDKRWVVQLKGGLEIPVSRSYRVTVQSAGLVGGSAMTED